jgi:hypothetical protein
LIQKLYRRQSIGNLDPTGRDWDVEVEIGDAGIGREKGGDRGLGKSVSICTFDEWFLALGAG